MGFFQSALNTVRDIGTSSVRLVTDFGLDTANLVTFNALDEPITKAKGAMRDVGVMSAAEAIEERQFTALKSLEKTVADMSNEFDALERDNAKADQDLNDRVSIINAMSNDITRISTSFSRLEDLQKQLDAQAQGHGFSESSGALHDALKEAMQRQHNIQNLRKVAPDVTKIVNNFAGMIAKTRTLSYGLSRAASLAKLAGAARFLKVGGKATVVLTAVTEAIGIGIDVAHLKQREDTANENIAKLQEMKRESSNQLAETNTKIGNVNAAINRVLTILNLTSEKEWSVWVQTKTKEIDTDLDEYTRKIRNLLRH